MRKYIKTITICLSLIILSACAPRMQAAKISFYENPSTGYMWSIQTDPSVSVETEYKPNSNDKNLAGGGGQRTFVLKPSHDGNYHIVFKYERSWEDDVPEELVEYDIEVNNGQITQTYSSYKSKDNQRINAKPLQIH